MATPGLDAIVDRWASDEQFREDFKADPETAIRDAGVELSDQEWESVRSFDASSMDDAELQERVNKCG